MVDRQWLGDLALAVLLVLPLAALARPQPPSHHPADTPFAKVRAADRLAASGRVSLLG